MLHIRLTESTHTRIKQSALLNIIGFNETQGLRVMACSQGRKKRKGKSEWMMKFDLQEQNVPDAVMLPLFGFREEEGSCEEVPAVDDADAAGPEGAASNVSPVAQYIFALHDDDDEDDDDDADVKMLLRFRGLRSPPPPDAEHRSMTRLEGEMRGPTPVLLLFCLTFDPVNSGCVSSDVFFLCCCC